MTAEERVRATKFVNMWRGETCERGESQTFWNEFFEVFGRSRRSVALFEQRAKKLGGYGFIDLFWPNKMIVEHKSEGFSLERALEQAAGYTPHLREEDIPRYILACDFARFVLVDLEERTEHAFALEELPDKVGLFGFMADRRVDEADANPVNQKATAMMADIYKSLADAGYPSGDMERLLTRLAFCMFSDDAGIFERGSFGRWLSGHTNGLTLGPMLAYLFQVLNKKERAGLSPAMEPFPYIDGDLFRDVVEVPPSTDCIRDLLIEANGHDWSKVSPAIFGGMFQAVLDKGQRRHAGAHYTTEENIMRVIRPLFLDDLRRELRDAKAGINRKVALETFQRRLAGLKFLDPACGSGNFLAIAYRELRRLELDAILEIHDTKTQRINVNGLSMVDVNQFYGIEINRFSAQIAEISMWMTDHLMNLELGDRYGIPYTRIPLKASPNIVCADALETDWNDVLPAADCDYVLGNPPYGGAKTISGSQRAQVNQIAGLGRSGGTLDYVAAWFFRAAEYSEKAPNMRIGYVATSSIIQGEQVGQLWPHILDRYGLKIDFAYRPFKWGSEAPGMARVHVVIIGLDRWNGRRRRLFHVDNDEVFEENPDIISPYLVGTERARIVNETAQPLNGLPKMKMGSKPIDNGHFIFTKGEMEEFLRMEPGAGPYIRPYIGAEEYIHGKTRYILALQDIEPAMLRRLPHVAERVEKVKTYRLTSRSPSTRRLADTPTLYHLNVMPKKPFLAIPEISSEKRKYIPIGYITPPAIPSNRLMVVPNASLGLFGLLTSAMHMVWLDFVGGKLETRYTYSKGVVYNTFPVPDSPLETLELPARAVLDARAAHPDSTLADLYDAVAMPPDLVKAHRRLDRKVDRLYRREPFRSDDERIEFLFERYGRIVD